MTNSTSMQRIIDNLRSNNPSMSIWADLDGLIIDIKPSAVTGIICNTTKEQLNRYFSTSSELANYLEQNYV